MATTRIGIVGAGWRSRFFLHIARALPDRFAVVGVVARRAEVRDRVTAEWGVATYADVDGLVAAQDCDLVITSVSWEANAGLVVDLVDRGLHVLSETPPAPDRAGLATLWDRVGDRDRVQVAEQYLALPAHAARLAVVRAGVVGTPTGVEVSSTHGYHAVAMIRGFLATGGVLPEVRAVTTSAPLVDPIHRDGWSHDPDPHEATTTHATLRFDGHLGVYDFTDNQWHNKLRARRVVVRGSRGELVDDRVVHLVDDTTILDTPLVRRQVGHGLDLDGHDTELVAFGGEVVWRNAFLGARLADEEVAIATVMADAAAWAADEGHGPYPLAEACQDHLVGLAIDEAAATGAPVTPDAGPWADHL